MLRTGTVGTWLIAALAAGNAMHTAVTQNYPSGPLRIITVKRADIMQKI